MFSEGGRGSSRGPSISPSTNTGALPPPGGFAVVCRQAVDGAGQSHAAASRAGGWLTAVIIVGQTGVKSDTETGSSGKSCKVRSAAHIADRNNCLIRTNGRQRLRGMGLPEPREGRKLKQRPRQKVGVGPE